MLLKIPSTCRRWLKIVRQWSQPAPSNQIQNQSTSSTHATSTVNGSVGPALDASFDLTVHGEAEEEEIVEQ